MSFKDFDGRLKTRISEMKEKTTEFFEASLNEVIEFAQKLKQHGLEYSEQLLAYLDTVPEEQKDEEIEIKEQEIGEKLF